MYDPRRWFAKHREPAARPIAAPPVAPATPTAPLDASPRDPLVGGGIRVPRRTRGWSAESRNQAPPTESELRGWAGTRMYHGQTTGHEEHPELQGDGWPIAERDMRRTDSSVGAIWRATRDSLLSARWSFKPGDSDHPVSRELADVANRLFGFNGHTGRLLRPWENALEQAVLYYPVGFRYGEVRFRRMPNGRIDIVDPWVDREPSAHYRWLFDDAGDWIGVQQRPPMGDLGRVLGSGPCIPADELIYLAHGVEGQNLSGCGALRPAYDPLTRKRDIEDLAMAATERWSTGVPELVIDESGVEAGVISRADLEQQAQKVRQSVGDFLTGDCAWIETTPWVSVRQFGGDLDPSRAMAQVEALDGAIKGTFLLQFLNLGTTPTGSRSVGEVHHDLWRVSLCQVLDRVAAAYNGHQRPGGGVIGRWVDLNWRIAGRPVDPDLYPRLEHAGLSVDPLVDAITNGKVESLTSAGWLDPKNQADRDRVRHRVGFGIECAEILDEEIGVGPTDEDGEPDLPEVRPGDYSSRNRDVADLLGCSTARVNSLVRRSVAAGLEVPAIGSGRDRLWELSRVYGWYAALTKEKPTDPKIAAIEDAPPADEPAPTTNPEAS